MHIYGIGTDIVEVERIKGVIGRKGSSFLERVFTRGEIAFCSARRDPYPCLAARFAAKEAVFKSLGTGLGGCRWTDVEVVRSGTGPPEVELAGNALAIAGEKGISRFMISISHDRGSAVAFVLAVREVQGF